MKSLLYVVFILLLGATGYAQGQPTKGMNKDLLLMNRLDRALNLTDAQEGDIMRIFTKYMAEIGGRENMNRDNIRSYKSEFLRRIESVLTEAQMDRFSKFRERFLNN